MKLLKTLLLTTLITLVPVKNSNAAVGAAMALFAAPAGATVALTGLTVSGTGYIISETNPGDFGSALVGGMAFWIGLLILDEQTNAVNFTQIDQDAALKLGLESEKVAIYNLEIDEANMIFEEVSSLLDADSSTDEARALWDEMSEFVSAETFEVMQGIASAK